MDTDSVPDDVRLIDVVISVVRDFSPEELPVLTGLRRLDDVEIHRLITRRSRSRGHDPLGFGVGEAVVLAAPIVWASVQHVANKMAGSVADSFLARVRKLLRRRPATTLPKFGEEELRRVRDTVREVASRSGMKQTKAEQLSALVVDRLMFQADDLGRK